MSELVWWRIWAVAAMGLAVFLGFELDLSNKKLREFDTYTTKTSLLLQECVKTAERHGRTPEAQMELRVLLRTWEALIQKTMEGER